MYDYVIVGAGSAGCVLANRLSEDPDVQVLLLEAGPPDTADFIHIPAAFSALFRSQNDWDLGTGFEPGLEDRRVYLPRGKTLGGSSSLNAMIYIRGNPADYDEWSELGWGWNDVLPYFLRAEDNTRRLRAPRRRRSAARVGLAGAHRPVAGLPRRHGRARPARQ
jgi:choline dehydrogenase